MGIQGSHSDANRDQFKLLFQVLWYYVLAVAQLVVKIILSPPAVLDFQKSPGFPTFVFLGLLGETEPGDFQGHEDPQFASLLPDKGLFDISFQPDFSFLPVFTIPTL